MTYLEAERQGAARLAEAGVENEKQESWFLLEYAAGMTRSDYYMHQMDQMPEETRRKFLELLEKRCSRIPLQYLTGEQEFMGLCFQVNEHVLIPRQDTETLAEEALKVIRPKDRILDLCCGSGCIGISLKHMMPECSVVLSDTSEEALQVAEKNAALNHCQVDLVCSDLFASLNGKFDVIVSNPPYIPADVIPTLMPEVRDHEPVLALDGRKDGLFFYRKITAESSRYLKPGGWLLFEIGYDQSGAVTELMRRNGFTDTETVKDLSGLDRVVKGRSKSDV